MSVYFVSFCALVCAVYCTESENADKSYSEQSECLENYWNSLVAGPPPRNYLYFHETRTPEFLSSVDDGNSESIVPFRWRIVGGKSVSITDIPYQVMYGKYCGATLISPEWVLTAAHCRLKQNYVYAGSTTRAETVPYKICAHFVHPLWNNTGKEHYHDFDYQLVLLEQPIPVTPYSRPVAIGSMEDVQPGTMVSVSGWGHMQYKDSNMEDILRRVFVPIIPNSICSSVPNVNYRNITQRMFCAGYQSGGKDSCQGDSGGPAVANGKLVGSVSFGVGCAMKDQPGVYANIPMARNWIRRVTGLPL